MIAVAKAVMRSPGSWMRSAATQASIASSAWSCVRVTEKTRPRVAQINHYPVKSLRQFLLKRTRRSGLGNKGRFADGYLNRFDINETERTEIHRFAPAVRAMMAEALADPAVQEAHSAAVRQRDERVAHTDPAQISREG